MKVFPWRTSSSQTGVAGVGAGTLGAVLAALPAARAQLACGHFTQEPAPAPAPREAGSAVRRFEVINAEVGQFLDSNTEAGRQYEIAPMVLTLRKSLLNELDYRREARNLVTLNENLVGFSRIVVPEPIEDYTTARVLTMDYIRGRKITSICAFIGVPWDERMRDFAAGVRQRGAFTPSGPQLARGLNAQGVGKWRDYADELAPVLETLAPWVERFGAS